METTIMPQAIETERSNPQIRHKGDMRILSPDEITIPLGMEPEEAEIQKIVEIIKNKGSLPDIFIDREWRLVEGAAALVAAKRALQPSVLVFFASSKNPTTQNLKISRISLDGGTQSRAEINQEIVKEYAFAWRDKAKFPPVTVFYDGENYWLADGFHRYYSAKEAELDEIDADIRQGTRRDAVLFSVGANSSHGLRRTNEDKRRAVITLLEDEEWGKWSDREIARRCGVDHKTVSSYRTPESKTTLQERTVNRGGSIYSHKVPAKKTSIPQIDEVVEITAGEFIGKKAVVRVTSTFNALCFVEGSDEDKRHWIDYSSMKKLEESVKLPTSVQDETKQAAKKYGIPASGLPEAPRNEGSSQAIPPLPATATQFNSKGNTVAEISITLPQLTPTELKSIFENTSFTDAQIEAIYSAIAHKRFHAA